MPTHTQLQTIWLLSDTVLYAEATAFLRHLVRDRQCQPLPASQVNGLLSIARSQRYDKLYEFVLHQRDRTWPPKQRDIKTFYTALEENLSTMQRRLRGDFHLLDQAKRPGGEQQADEQELMALLAREFIQHLVAENGLLSISRVQQTGTGRRTQHRPTGGTYGN